MFLYMTVPYNTSTVHISENVQKQDAYFKDETCTIHKPHVKS